MQSRSAWEAVLPALRATDEEIAESQQKAQQSAPFRQPGEKSNGQVIGLL